MQKPSEKPVLRRIRARLSRRTVLKAAVATGASVVLTPFEAFARGIPVEGISANYAARATAALEAMSALREVRAAKSQLRERLMKLDPYGDEWHQAGMQESLLWLRQREADHRAYIALMGAAFMKTTEPQELALELRFRGLFRELNGMHVDDAPDPDWAMWAEKRAAFFAKRRALRASPRRTV